MSQIQLQDSARVWSFIPNRLLSETEKNNLEKLLSGFTKEWTAHDHQLLAGFEILKDCILIVAVDEAFEAPSGCSIDKVFRLLTQFGVENTIDFFQRTSIVQLDSDPVNIYTKKEAEIAFSEKIISANTIVFNSQIRTILDLKNDFGIAFSNSWLGKNIVATTHEG